MSDQLALFAGAAGADVPRPPSAKDRIHAAQEARHRAHLDVLRVALRAEFARLQRPLSSDDAWRLMEERKELRLPPGMHPNALGGLFNNDRDEQGRPRWELMGLVVSKRDKANDNLLRSWALIR